MLALVVQPVPTLLLLHSVPAELHAWEGAYSTELAQTRLRLFGELRSSTSPVQRAWAGLRRAAWPPRASRCGQ